MADMNNPTHSLGSGHPHHHQVNHTRPFFYVQSPSQPFYMYQWNMNMNPYGHPASALSYMRQYVAPYPYMSGYPGYVMPQAPIYPVDYRQMFNPHLSLSSAYDVHLRHQYCHITRETASSEVQTDHSDALTKQIGSQDGLKTSEIAGKEDKEPVTSDMKVLLPEIRTRSSSDIGKMNETVLKPLAQRQRPITRQTEAHLNGHILHQPHPHTLLQPMPSDSTTQEVSNAESILSDLVEASWALKPGAHLCDKAQCDTQSLVSGIDILPLDSSSVNGEDEDVECCLEAPCLVSKNTEDCEKSEALHPKPDASLTEGHHCWVKNPNLDLSRASTEHELLDAAECLRQELYPNQAQKVHHAGALELMNGKRNPGVEAEEELPYRILRLPCDKVTTGMLQHESLCFIDPSTSTTLPPQNYLSLASSSSAYYSYYPHSTIQVATERQSILSPSLDERSSRDELFSTDIDNLDNDLIVRGDGLLSSEPVYIGGGKMAPEGQTQDSGKETCIPLAAKLSKMCLQTCMCCGTSLAKNNGRMAFGGEEGRSMRCEYPERPDEAEQVEVEYREEEAAAEEVTEGAEVPGSCSMPRQQQHHYCYSSTRSLPHAYPPPYLPPLHLYPRSRSRKMCDCEEHEGVEEMAVHDEQQGHGYGRDYCPPASATSKANKYKGRGQRIPPARTYSDQPWMERAAATAPDSWGSCGAKYKPRSSRPHNGTDEVCPQRKRPACKTLVPQRRADHDYKESEVSHGHRSRGSTKRRNTRY